MYWTVLIIAGLMEVGWAVGLKYTAGFTRLWESVWTVVAMILSLFLLGIAMKAIPFGTAYAVWVGIGIIGTAIFGILLFNEPAGLLRMAFIGLILAGIIGLKVTAKPANPKVPSNTRVQGLNDPS